MIVQVDRDDCTQQVYAINFNFRKEMIREHI